MARFITSPHAQRTPGWHADRCGKLTGSKVVGIFTKRGDNETRTKLKYDLAFERVTGQPTPGPRPTADMRWGNAQEPFNRMRYEGETGLTSIERGFMYLPRLKAGCSIDGEVHDNGRFGINEFKCPGRRAHYSYIEGGVLPALYVPQVNHNMWVTGAEFCDFQSYDPRLPENLQIFRIRYERDQLAIEHHERTVLQFLMEVDDLEDQMRRRVA
ncbi:YqaJ viral recombinase family protein [Variovorax boronicumulans]|uniref:YqaJ viral recombinase family protein n=1 Tax=Variovorax boronicumulans TaxID=436515 RepID=UPI0012E46B98|nr:YqaJ viral recombinase family protein [Variovorax boronicumulans]GER16727.1 exonuclease [Variovorax boronicumulans]